MFEQQATIKNHQGIHCRPSAVIMNSVQDYTGVVSLSCPKGDCPTLSILGIMSLCLEFGETVTVQVRGENEEQVCRDLVELFETEFDFPPRPGSDQ